MQYSILSCVTEQQMPNENISDRLTVIKQAEIIRSLQEQLKQKEINERAKKEDQKNNTPGQIRRLPQGLGAQKNTNPKTSRRSKIEYICNEPNCDECKHISNPVRHFLEKISPVIEKCNRDIDKVCSITVSESDAHVPEELGLNLDMFSHFKGCHLCLLFWRDRPFFENLVTISIGQRNLDKSYNTKPCKKKK